MSRGGQRKNAGRKPRGGTKRFTVLLTPEEEETWRASAAAQGKTLSTWVRAQCLPTEPDQEDILLKAATFAVQIMHKDGWEIALFSKRKALADLEAALNRRGK